MVNNNMIKVDSSNAVQECDARMFISACLFGLKKYLFIFIFLLTAFCTYGQLPDKIYKDNVKCVRFHLYGDQESMPIYNLNSAEQLELNFDDMDANVKNYYYTYQLCDYSWKPVDISPFMYIKGFTQQRITTNRYSSIALTKYIHYQAMLPDRNTTITMSGNYLLKIFLDGDTSKLVFTRRLLVLEQQATIAARVVQPLTPQWFKTHQKLQFNANVNGISAFSAAQQIKVVILQNNRWDNAIKDIPPTFVRGKSLEYNTENNCIFPGGKEWRWLDLRSLRLQSDRVERAEYKTASTNIFLKTDGERSNDRYVRFQDLNGLFRVMTYETINPNWQGDFATVQFNLAGPNGQPYANKDVYLAGQLTDYAYNDKTKMTFNATKGVYECSLFLKQGCYNYTYVLVDQKNPAIITTIEGDYWETENNYTILMYYKAFSDRADKLISVAQVNSRGVRAGMSF
jgi:hypothetical protein